MGCRQREQGWEEVAPGIQDSLHLAPYAPITQYHTPMTLPAPIAPYSNPQTLFVCLPKTPSLWTHKTHHPDPKGHLPPSLSGVVFNDVYAASKFALEGFFESLAIQLLQFNIL